MKKLLALGAMRNVVCCMVIMLPLQINTGLIVNDNYNTNTEYSESTDEVPLSSNNVILLDLNNDYCGLDCFIAKNQNTIKFLTDTFGVDYDQFINNLIEINQNNTFIETNLGRLTNANGELNENRTLEEGVIEYLIDYTKNNPSLTKKTIVPYTGSSDYVENLIRYFTSIYDNVDTNTALSIGAAESGYYKVKFMLKSNNIYGGISSDGLIKYKNIEYGVLTYVRTLSKNYYAKGLDTIYSIGKVYCPTYDGNGNKIASPHWINLVNNAMDYYNSKDNSVSIELLLND